MAPQGATISHTPQLYKEPSQPVYERRTDIERRPEKVVLIVVCHSHITPKVSGFSYVTKITSSTGLGLYYLYHNLVALL